jgi:hypothetical protein
MAKIYVAGKDINRAKRIIEILKRNSHEITYDWPNFIEIGPTKEKAIREWEAVKSSELLVYLWEPGQESARYEAGMAMGLGLPIIVSGNFTAFFFQLPNIHVVDSDEFISDKISEITH